MPPKALHLEVAEKNAQFAKTLDNGPEVNRGWAATAAFYSALHLIEAVFANQTPPAHSADHRTRDSSIQKHAITQKIYDEYQELKNISQQARYHGVYPTNAELQQDIFGNLDTVHAELTPHC